MHRQVRISLRRAAQPTPAAWRDAVESARHLAACEELPLTVVDDVALHLDIPSEADDRLEVVLRALREAAARSGVTWQEYRTQVHEEADLGAADLLVVTGVGLDDPDRMFLLNEDEALDPDHACPVCGSRRPENRSLRGVPRVDSALATRPAATVRIDGNPDPVRNPNTAWDAVNLVNRALVVSARLIGACADSGARGFGKAPVADASGRKLEGFAILLASHAVRSCTEHSGLPADGVCPRCGAVLAERQRATPLQVRESALDGFDVVSLGPHLYGPLAVRPMVLEAWRATGIEGVSPIRPITLCPH
jgi:rubredoxin